MWREYLLRAVQLVIGVGLFEAPLLMRLRVMVYAYFFNGKTRGAHIHRGVIFSVPHGIKTARIAFGEEIDINHGVEIDYSGCVTIGNRVWISQGVLIETHEHVISAGRKDKWPIQTSPLVIEDDVWIGAHVIVLPRVERIGRGAVVGAGSILTRSVPEGAVVAGNPARVLRIRDVEEKVS